MIFEIFNVNKITFIRLIYIVKIFNIVKNITKLPL